MNVLKEIYVLYILLFKHKIPLHICFYIVLYRNFQKFHFNFKSFILRHILIMDSLTMDISARKSEISLIYR